MAEQTQVTATTGDAGKTAAAGAGTAAAGAAEPVAAAGSAGAAAQGGTKSDTSATAADDLSLDGAAPAATEGKDAVVKDGKAAEPAEIELKLPEGFKPDEPVLKDFKGVAKELGLKSEQAQKFLDFYAKTQSAAAAKEQADIQAARAEWREAIKADKEFGGAKLQESLAAAKQAYAKLAPDSTKALFKSVGLDAHPEVLRLFYRLSKGDAEGSLAGTGGGAPGPTAEQKEAARLRSAYPTMFQG